METKLPEGWEIKKLVKHTPIIKTGVPKYDGEKPYYSTGVVDADGVVPEGMYAFKNKPSRANRIVKMRDVVQARMQGTKKALIINQQLDGSLFSTGFIHFRPEESNYNSRLFYHYLSSELFLKQRDEYASGSTQIALTDKGAKNIDLIIPPKDCQEKISDKLDSLLAKLKDAQSRLDKIPLILKRFRQSILASAFSGELTKDWREEQGVDNSWQECCIGDVIEDLKYGTSQKCFKEKRKHAVLRIPNIVQGCIDVEDLKYADLPDKEYEKLKLHEGDILLIRSNGSVSLVGKTALVKDIAQGMAYAGYLIRLRLNRERILPEFLQYQFQSYAMRIQIELPARSTSGVNNINSDEVKNLKIALPAIEEQKEIVIRIKTLFDHAEKIERRYLNAKKYTDKLEQSILAKAFRGELVSLGGRYDKKDKFNSGH